MPDYRRASCRTCGAHRSEVGLLSWRGYCGPCGRAALEENVDGIHARAGAAWERRRYGIVRSTLGDEVANALFKAGVFDAELDDAAAEA